MINLNGYCGFSTKFSPYTPDRIACASSANFGILGNGRLFILDKNKVKTFDTTDALFDCCWSEYNENLVLTCSGDGYLMLWDVSSRAGLPVCKWKEHDREVYSVSWNQVERRNFLSCSWDCTIKLWDPNAIKSLVTWKEHGACVYCVVFSPRSAYSFATASGDGSIKVFDTRLSGSSISLFPLNQEPREVLAVDFNKYSDHIICSGGVDGMIRVWDIRNPKAEVFGLRGHELGIRKVQYSPYLPDTLASCGYDMNLLVWNDKCPDTPVFCYSDHTEFVTGLDFNLHCKNELISCSWDQTVVLHKFF